MAAVREALAEGGCYHAYIVTLGLASSRQAHLLMRLHGKRQRPLFTRGDKKYREAIALFADRCLRSEK